MTQPTHMPETRQIAPERAEEPKQAAGTMSPDGERTQGRTARQGALIVRCPSDCSYINSPTQLDLLSADRRVVIGVARRTGVTPPGYEDRAVYRLRFWNDGYPGDWGNDYYVYDAGDLVIWGEWLEAAS